MAVGGLVQKYLYDGADRPTTVYASDGGGDTAPGPSNNSWSTATSIGSNIVLSQVETQYDAFGNTIFVADRERMHDDPSTDTGALGTPTSGNPARVYYSADYYDAANRMTDSVDFGTNQGTAMTSPPALGSIPSWALHTVYGYDSAGNQNSVTDPRGIQTITTFDMLHRPTQVDAGHTTGGSPAASIDQTTTYTYNGDNETLTMTAQVPGAHNETTQWSYNTTPTGGYQVRDNDRLKKVSLPDPSTGNANGNTNNSYTYFYDNLGEPYYDVSDPNGSQTSFTFDVLGRMIQDNAAGLGTNVDGSVRSLVYGFDTNGQLSTASSYSGASGTGSLLNQVEEQYNGYGQVTGEWQSHSGAVNTSNPPQVQYNYTYGSNSSTGQTYSRLTSMTYPNGRQLDFVYNSGLDSNISRVSGLSDDSGTGAGNIESYSYLGLGTIVQRNRPNGVNLTLARLNTSEGTGDGGDQYIGLDRFGRVVDQRWTTSGGTAADRFQYGYDQGGNVLYKNNLVFSLASELYHPNGTGNGLGYDALNRMVSFTRGTLTASNGTLDTVTVANQDTNLPQHTETWNLDVLGNWTGNSAITIDGTNQNRSVDSRNRYTAVGGNSVTSDNIGNIVQDETGLKYVYDIWNRVVKVENSSGGVLETYTYDAFGRRITETPNGQTTKDLYFDGSKVIEEQQAGTTTNQYVWGLGYVNSLVLRDDNSSGGNYGKTGSGLGRRLFVQQDADWNVTSLVDSSGNVQERFVYDPYGRVQVVDKTTWNTSTDSFNWIYHFQGGRQDPISGLVHFGTPGRDYSTTLGRWTEPDSGYIDGANVYQGDGSNPVGRVDPTGADEQIIGGGIRALPPPPPPQSTAPVSDHVVPGQPAGNTGSSDAVAVDPGPVGDWTGTSWLAPGIHDYVSLNLPPLGLSFGNMPSDFGFRNSNAWAEYLHTAVYINDGSSTTDSSSGGGSSLAGGLVLGIPFAAGDVAEGGFLAALGELLGPLSLVVLATGYGATHPIVDPDGHVHEWDPQSELIYQLEKIRREQNACYKNEQPHTSASGRPTDEYGNVLGPSGKPMVHTPRYPTRKGAKDGARNGGAGAPQCDPSPSKGRRHFHSTDNNGDRMHDGVHHEY